MSREFPDFVDPWKAADGRRTFQGTMPINRMKRLESMLAPDPGGPNDELPARGEAGFTARFSYDRQGLITIRLDVEAELLLVCQRSLEPYREKVRRHSWLVVIEDIAEQDLIPEQYDPVLVEHRRMALLDIVEDELLMAIPQVPRSPESKLMDVSTDGKTAIPSGEEKTQTYKPFAGLAGLMKENAED